MEVDGVDSKGKNRKSKAYTLVEAPINIKSIDAEINLDCPLKSSDKAANMAYKLEPVESHEIDIEAIQDEEYSEAVNSESNELSTKGALTFHISKIFVRQIVCFFLISVTNHI